MAVFTLRGTIEAKWLTSAPASLAAPAIATELNTGTDIVVGGASVSERLATMAGWTTTPGTIEAPGADTMVTPTIPGETDLGTGSLTYYIDDTTYPIDTLLAEGATGWIVLMPEGETAGNHSTVISVEVTTNQIDWQVDNQPATFTVTLSKTGQTEGALAA